ncbi:hypothetical protein [Variovorax sp.]|jgi:hypothetical protein|uniref:hypothetical protein n=2 Tax=Variovorax sp. TaxID=1871043 RepID=UPI0011F565C9|nr:hypothetical protein [Variovorax sp.]TAJ63627.1 MAG: hypothetical protein EPO53_14950 [Variovorax sp.]
MVRRSRARILRNPIAVSAHINIRELFHMTHESEADPDQTHARGTRRRSLLKAGLALPLGTSALLAACGGGGSSSGFSPTPVAVAPPPSPAVVPTPPVDPPPPRPVEKAVKNVRVLNLQTPSTAPLPDQRLKDEPIETYTRRALQAKFNLLSDALAQGLPKKSAPTDLCFFVVPEFFWNVNWDAVRNEEEIKAFSTTCVIEVQKHVRALIALFPQDQYGKLALLPGTSQVLMKQLVEPPAAPAPQGGPVKDEDLPPYEALNYVLVIDNFSKANPDGSRPIAMWPKRNVSWIDFDTDGGTQVLKDGRAYWKVLLGHLDILVLMESTTTAAYYADGKQYTGFDNDPLGGVPFGVDVCLDYMASYTEKQYLRMSQIEDTNYIIDFLLAAGMTADPETHKYLPSVQYIVRNDGYYVGACEIFQLSAPTTSEGIAKRPGNTRVAQTAVANLAPNTILFDAYFDVHPLGQYPEIPDLPDLPTEPLPSPFVPTASA